MGRVVFLGRLRDAAGTSERDIETPTTIATYLSTLENTQPELHSALTQKGIRTSLNMTLLLVGHDADLKAGDELAFMPPYSGG